MLTSVLEGSVSVGPYPELAGKRVLVTGLELQAGVDVARAFAEQGCRIVLHTTASGAEADAVLEMLAQTASELQVYSDPLTDIESTTRFAQTAAKTFSGVDAVVNLIHLDLRALSTEVLDGDFETAIARRLQTARVITRIAANRMRLTWSEGLVFNVLVSTPPQNNAETALLSMARAMLASMTRSEASEWADQAIRINAVAPVLDSTEAGACLVSEPQVAALAMFLASSRGRDLSGLVFDLGLVEHA
ncbi:MAG TPA: SDR family oxidoreductase [Hyphomicrobiaceae bacterium]|nr:SDR family oxidoreductase [Hyphomicrobiaceae bacterium]